MLTPENGGGGNGVKGLNCIQATDSLIVVASDHEDGLQSMDLLDDLIWGSSVANQISEEKEIVDLTILDKFQKRDERL